MTVTRIPPRIGPECGMTAEILGTRLLTAGSPSEGGAIIDGLIFDAGCPKGGIADEDDDNGDEAEGNTACFAFDEIALSQLPADSVLSIIRGSHARLAGRFRTLSWTGTSNESDDELGLRRRFFTTSSEIDTGREALARRGRVRSSTTRIGPV